MGYWYRLSKWPNYIKRFGLMNGSFLLLRVERRLPKKSTVVKQYAVPDFPAPIHLRESLSDHSIFWQCIVRRQYDFTHFPQYQRLIAAYHDAVKKGQQPLIIDCGGNIGLASIWFAMQFPDAVLYSVEPDRENFELLKLNTSNFGTRIRPLLGGIWNQSGFLKIVNPESGSAAFRVDISNERSDDSIRAYTIAEICALAGVESPFIVKIDIEGAQANLFMNNTDWVSKTHLISLELDDWLLPWRGTSRPFFSCLSKYPFDYLLGEESIFCFRDFSAGADTKIGFQ
jgi:FkbM family methyltransferase